VLAVGLFIAFWVVLGIGLLLFAIRGRGGGRAPSRSQTRWSNRLLVAGFMIILLGFGLGLPLAILIGNHAKANNQVGGLTLTAAEKRGRELFGQHCAVCHTLAAANAVGKVGPNLDTIRPSATLTLHTINNGCLPNAPNGSAQQCLGEGVMPSDVVTGRDAQDVSAFVARVAGNE
jgi:mono/diheme cytochrome c family protein